MIVLTEAHNVRQPPSVDIPRDILSHYVRPISSIYFRTWSFLLDTNTSLYRWYTAHLLPHYQPYIKDKIADQLARTRQKLPAIKIDFHPNRDPRTAYNSSKLALLIEARPIPHLVPQILHMISVVPSDWRFLFIGSNDSVHFVGGSLAMQYQQVAGKLDLMIAPEPWSIAGKEHVYRMLTDRRFYDELLPGVEWILKYEADSILCANSDDSLNNWLDYDWAGAAR